MKKVLSLLLAALLLLGLCTAVSADENLKSISAYLNSGITIRYNGEAQTMYDANNNRVFPLTYEGTTYLPVRAVSNMLSVSVRWDGENNTVWLGEGSETAMGAASIPQLMDVNQPLKSVNAFLNYGITICYKSVPQTMYNANGTTVYPLTYEGTTYLPVRAVSAMLEVPVLWDGENNTVWLGKVPAGTVLTRGTQTAKGYESTFTGIGFTLPSGWKFFSDAEVQSLLGTSYAYGTSLQDIIEQTGSLCDMFARGSGSNMNIMIENKPESMKGLPFSAAFDNNFDSLRTTLQSVYDYVNMTKAIYTIDGQDFYGIDIECVYQGSSMFQKCMFIDLGNYVGTMTITAYQKADAENYFKNLYLVK